MEDKEEYDVEDEMDKLEEEIEETPKKTTSTKKKVDVEEEEVKPTERYVAFYQEPRIGILDSLTKEVVVEGLKDLPTATIEAIKLNKLDRIEIASGA